MSRNLFGEIPSELDSEMFDFSLPSYADESGTPGDATMDVVCGRAAIDVGADEAVISCKYCSATSVVVVQMELINGGATTLVVLPEDGQFTVTANSNATSAALPFSWYLVGEARY